MPFFDLLPCPVLVTDRSGVIQSLNQELLEKIGGTAGDWVGKPMDALFSAASCIFMQTHVWPMLLREGRIREIRLQMRGMGADAWPVFVNSQQSQGEAGLQFTWVLYVTVERSRFEQELVDARKRAELASKLLASSERFLRTVADALPSMIAYWDAQLCCQFANAAYVEWFGKTPGEMQGLDMRSLLGNALFEKNWQYVQGALQGQPQEFARVLQRPDGSEGHMLANYIPDMDAQGQVTGFISLVTNVSRMWEADEAIRLSASVFEATAEGIVVTDPLGNIVSVNQSFCALTGFRAHEIAGQNVRLFHSDRHDVAFFADMLTQLQENKAWAGEVWSRRKDGSTYLAQLSLSSITDDAGNVTRHVGVASDVTERWDKEQFIQQMALHDSLTGLPNRRLLMERLGQLIAIAARNSRQICVMFMDLDGFKAVNDTWGHDVGDQVLKEVAKRLQALLRGSDTVVRLGGDEFVLVLDNPDSEGGVEIIARRVIANVNEPMVLPGCTARVGTSLGIALFPHHGNTPEGLLKNADIAMYTAKVAGKNVYRYFQ